VRLAATCAKHLTPTDRVIIIPKSQTAPVAGDFRRLREPGIVAIPLGDVIQQISVQPDWIPINPFALIRENHVIGMRLD
jgi:hypothetical protein